MSDITNETVVALMNSNHVEMVRRLDKIDAKQEYANQRLGKAEVAIAVLQSTQVTKDDSVPIPKKYLTMAIAVGTAMGAALMEFFRK